MSILQNPQMLRDCGPVDGEILRDRHHRKRAVAKAGQDGTTGCIAEGIELSFMVSLH